MKKRDTLTSLRAERRKLLGRVTELERAAFTHRGVVGTLEAANEGLAEQLRVAEADRTRAVANREILRDIARMLGTPEGVDLLDHLAEVAAVLSVAKGQTMLDAATERVTELLDGRQRIRQLEEAQRFLQSRKMPWVPWWWPW